jgi:predicted amidohydrolase YtcJ
VDDKDDATGTEGPSESEPKKGLSRKGFLATGAAAGAAVGLGGAGAAFARPKSSESSEAADASRDDEELVLYNGKIHTMDGSNRVVSGVVIRNGRFVEVDKGVPRHGKAINLKGRTVIPGIIDAHNHIVLVGNRPGWSTPVEDVFTIPEVVERYQERSAEVPPGEFITTIGPLAAMQLAEQRLPNLTELDAVNRPVYIQAANGGTRTNSLGKTWLEARGIVVAADGAIGGGATGSGRALQLLREQLLTPETRKRSALDALQYFTRLGITTHKDEGAFHSELPSTGIASENTYTMHNPFLALHSEGKLPARMRIDFLHQDPATDPTLPTLSARLRNSFPFFGDDWFRTGGIGEFTGGGVDGLRAIARAGWRGEDHALSLNAATTLIANREIVHAEIPITDLRWVISHIPGFTEDLANRFHAMGGGVLVGWGPHRTGTNVGPPYRLVFDHPIQVGWHSDGGDITVISPWLNLYTTITGRNLRGDHILGDQTLTRQEALHLATAANKWFIKEEDLGSIEVGNHADLAVLDRDFFTVPDEDIKKIQSVLTIVGGNIVHDTGDVK